MPATFSRVRARVAIPLILLLTLGAGLAGLGLASAQAPYSVQSGDTLLDIAIKNGVPEGQLDLWISQVVVMNSLTSPDALEVGQKLTLPVLAPSGGGSGSAGGGTSAAPLAGSSYTVKSGDTLYGIAETNGVSDLGSWIDAVLSLNKLSSADTIAEGDVLKLPGHSAAGGSSTSSGTSFTAGSTVEYTVQSGDTLYDIAVKNGVAEADLGAWLDSVLKLNKLDSPDLLKLGEALKVPSKKTGTATGGAIKSTASFVYVVKSGDTLYDIALKNGARDTTFAAWLETVLGLNNLTSPDVLREGESLKLPEIEGAAAPATSSGSSGGINAAAASQATPGGFRFSGDSVTYTVKAGETWTGIARKLLTPEEQLGAWIEQAQKLSLLAKDDKLVEGIVLLVPAKGSLSPAGGGSTSPTSTSATTATPAAPTARSTTTYTVQPGDTLSDIAEKLKVAPGQLSSWIKDVLDLNKMSSADILTVGQKLTVPGEAPSTSTSTAAGSGTPASTPKPPATPPSFTPPPAASSLVRGNNGTCYYTILSGDSWDSIAQKLGVSAEKRADWVDGIAALNGIKGAALPIGDSIRLLC